MEEICVELPEELLAEFRKLCMNKYGKNAEEIITEFIKWVVYNPEEAKEYLLKYAE